MRRLLPLLLLLCSPALADPLTNGTPAVNSDPTGSWLDKKNPVCSNATIPAGNTVTNSTTETAFSSTCVVKANTASAGNAIHLHVAGIYSSAVGQSATGKVKFTNNASIAIATDSAIFNSGSVGGLAASTNQEWFGDLYITFQTGATAIEVQGYLTFQTGANATVTVPVANTASFTVDPTKDLTIYLTVTWGAAMAANSMQLRTMIAK